jgi:carboxymethylenebutenolidase
LGQQPRRSTGILVPLVLGVGLGFGTVAGGQGVVVETDATFKSRGKDVVVDVFAPRAPGRYPAVVVLHGHGGVGEGKRSGTHEQARFLAGSGYVALVPHYFGLAAPDRRDGRKNARSFATWSGTVSETVGFAARRADVDPKRVGLVGSSLGSWVALAVAARDRRVSAVVENFGGFPVWEPLDPSRLPPVLVLHGDADRNVPVEEAYRVERILREAGVVCEAHIYPGAGHGFRGADREDAARRTLEFLDTHVKRAKPAGEVPPPLEQGGLSPDRG